MYQDRMLLSRLAVGLPSVTFGITTKKHEKLRGLSLGCRKYATDEHGFSRMFLWGGEVKSASSFIRVNLCPSVAENNRELVPFLFSFVYPVHPINPV